ncbi:hypothetical protein [Pricia sp.]|uniref:hypothetical protein n=1 Tax=Pricia sp. TaxID=2268138 RepID=UPI003593F8A7
MKLLKALSALIYLGIFATGCEDILEVPDISGRQVEIVAPKDRVVVENSQVNFTWNGVADADSYSVQIARPNFREAAQILLDSTIVLDSTFIGTKAIKNLDNGDYEWRVKALNSDFRTEFSSSAFKVEASAN